MNEKRTKRSVAIDWTKTAAIIGALITSIYTGANSASSHNLDYIVDQLNNRLVPQLQEQLNAMNRENRTLLERFAKLEAQNNYLEKRLDGLRNWMASKSRGSNAAMSLLAAPTKESEIKTNAGAAPKPIELPKIDARQTE